MYVLKLRATDKKKSFPQIRSRVVLEKWLFFLVRGFSEPGGQSFNKRTTHCIGLMSPCSNPPQKQSSSLKTASNNNFLHTFWDGKKQKHTKKTQPVKSYAACIYILAYQKLCNKAQCIVLVTWLNTSPPLPQDKKQWQQSIPVRCLIVSCWAN